MSKELELAIKISGKIDRSLGSALNNAQKQLDSISATTNRAMMSATVAAATAGAAIVVESTQKAMQYEKSMAGVAKVVDGCRDVNGKLTDTYYELSNGILDMSTKIPMAAEGIASIVESAGQAGIAKTELLGFAESAAKMGIAFDTTAEQAGDWMAQWRTSMRLTQPQVEVLADQINYLGNTSSEKATKLAEVVSRVGSLGDIAGLSGGQVAALAASMPGVEAEISATGIKNLTRAMTMGEAATKKQKTVLSQLGFSATDLANRMQKDATGAIMDLLGAMSKLPEAEQSAALSRYFGNESIAAIAPLLANLENLEEQFAKVADATRYSGSMQMEYEAAAATTANKVELLRNQISKEMIELGNEITPILSESIDKISDKIPQLADQIGDSLEDIIPLLANGFGYLVDNSDTILATAEGLIKTFAIFKIGTGAINGINSIATLGKNLKAVTATAGAVPVMKGVFATLTGVSGAGTAASIVSTLGPLALLAGGFVAVGAAINAAHGAWYDYNYKWGDSLELQSHAVSEQADEVLKLKDYQKELSQLEFIINSPESSTEEVNAAQSKLEEIAQILSKEYNLTINVDAGNLSQAAEDATKVLNALEAQQRLELNENVAKYIGDLNSATERYQTANAELPQKQAERDTLNNNNQLLSGLLSSAVIDANAYDISGDLTAYVTGMQEIATKLKDTAIFDRINEKMPKAINPDRISEELVDADMLNSFLSAMHAVSFDINKEFTNADSKLNDLNASIEQFNTSANSVGDSLMRILANDIINGNVTGIESTTEQFKELGKTLINAGANTDGVAVKFATAQMGYTSFADAIANGKAAEAAQNFYNYQTAIGVSAEAATAGAALIQNGFENAAQATTAGNDAILGVIANINSLGAMNGVFDGLTNTADIEAKLTGIARAMNLIPANKAVKLDVNGNLSLIEQTAAAVNETPQAHNTELTTSGGALQTVNELDNALKNLPTQKNVNITVTQNGSVPTATTVVNGSHYSGLERVPFDGYIAELHKDERVLTADEAAVYNSRDDSPASIDVLRERIFGVSGGDEGGQRQFVFSPKITVQGNADRETIETAVKMTYNDFLDFMEEYESDTRRKRF